MGFSFSGRTVGIGRWLFQHRSLGWLTLVPAVLVLREQERPFQHVFKFPRIARPGVVDKQA